MARPILDTSGTYDNAIVGTGVGGLVLGALLARAGRRVIVFDRHYLPGGYAQTFRAGEFHFCADLHYVWDCGPGERVYRVLEHLGLAKAVKFRRLDPTGFDRVVGPGVDYLIGSGYARECPRLAILFPEHARNLARYFEILTHLHREAYQLPLGYSWSTFFRHPFRYSYFIRYMGWTLQNLFDLLKFPPRLQLILAGQSAIFLLPPRQLSLVAHAAGVGGYDAGACVPEISFRHVILALVNAISRAPGCRVALSTPISRIPVSRGRVTGVVTSAGEFIAAREVIFDGDAQLSLNLIGPELFPPSFRSKLRYDYGASVLSIYLGLKGIDIRDIGLGEENLFWYPTTDLNAAYARQFAEAIPEEPLFFCDSPTLRMHDPTLAPPGGHQLVMGTPCSYSYFEKLRNRSEAEYTAAKEQYAARVMDVFSREYFPTLRRHVVTQVIGSPLTNERYVAAPRGNCYGVPLDPAHIHPRHLNFHSPFPNFYYAGTSAGMPGFAPNVHFSAMLYERLTGDCFYSLRSMASVS